MLTDIQGLSSFTLQCMTKRVGAFSEEEATEQFVCLGDDNECYEANSTRDCKIEE